MSIAYIFPGQGSQQPGMGKEIYENFPEAAEVYNRAKAITGKDWAEISFEGDKETLSQTQNTQPCIFLNSIAILRALKSHSRFEAAAGHSLGEYSALVAVGVLDFDSAIRCVVERGRLMSEARSGGMLAPLGAEDSTVVDVVGELREKGDIVVANFNAPGQLIVSGEEALLESASEALKTGAGAKKVLRLPVSAAFHSPLMQDAKAEMAKILAKVEFYEPKAAFFANATGGRIENPEDIRRQLIEQITSPVRWIDQVKAMAAFGTEEFVEIGPGKVLQGLVSRIISTANVRGIFDVESIERETQR
jgi:[acyl-carrier-protein] S-malonyltransferase